jgi:hypothetical protein
MSTLPPKLENLRSKINERRKSIEQIRSFNVRRLQTDIKKITKQEIDFTKKLLEQMVPVKMVWNEEATKRLRDMVPFTVELNREEEEEAGEEAGSDSLSTTKSADEL